MQDNAKSTILRYGNDVAIKVTDNRKITGGVQAEFIVVLHDTRRRTTDVRRFARVTRRGRQAQQW
jgi:hypothetical protein